jgi:hypothetical protein
MNTNPYLTITHGHLNTHTTTLTIRETQKTIPPDQPLYLLDTDGLTTNHPNYNTYQRLSTKNPLWIDAGPRTTNDIIDLIMAGATTIVIRTPLYPDPDIHELNTITDLDIYLYYDTTQPVIPPETTGLIIPTPPPPPPLPLRHTTLPRYLLNLDPTIPLPQDESYTGAFVDLSVFTPHQEHP